MINQDLTYTDLNKQQLWVSHFVKKLKALKSLKSFKQLTKHQELYVVLAFCNDTPLRAIIDGNETIDLFDVKDIFYVDQYNSNDANNIIREMDLLNKEFSNYSFNYRKVTLNDFREILISIQEIKLKSIIKMKASLKQKGLKCI